MGSGGKRVNKKSLNSPDFFIKTNTSFFCSRGTRKDFVLGFFLEWLFCFMQSPRSNIINLTYYMAVVTTA